MQPRDHRPVVDCHPRLVRRPAAAAAVGMDECLR